MDALEPKAITLGVVYLRTEWNHLTLQWEANCPRCGSPALRWSAELAAQGRPAPIAVAHTCPDQRQLFD